MRLAQSAPEGTPELALACGTGDAEGRPSLSFVHWRLQSRGWSGDEVDDELGGIDGTVGVTQPG